jgi:outer membrane protein OmpA-like peptidoglycan-associated protein
LAAERQYHALREQLERNEIRFGLGTADIPADEVRTLNRIASEISAMLGAAAFTGREVRIEILGSTDPRGKPELNASLARDRAEGVRAALAALGIPGEHMTAKGSASPCGLARASDDAACRTAALRVLEELHRR